VAAMTASLAPHVAIVLVTVLFAGGSPVMSAQVQPSLRECQRLARQFIAVVAADDATQDELPDPHGWSFLVGGSAQCVVMPALVPLRGKEPV